MRQSTPKACPECGARETRGTVLHRPTCSQRVPFGPLAPVVSEIQNQGIGLPVLRNSQGLCAIRECPNALVEGLEATSAVELEGAKATIRMGLCRHHYDLLLPPGGLTAITLGRKGGQSRARNLTPEARSESARRAAKARWGKRDA